MRIVGALFAVLLALGMCHQQTEEPSLPLTRPAPASRPAHEPYDGPFPETPAKFALTPNAGKYVIAPQFDEASDFSEGLAAVEINGKRGFINHAGEVVIAPVFKYAHDFSDGWAEVCMERCYQRGLWNYVDHAGHLMFKHGLPQTSRFSEGLAVVGMYRGDSIRYGYIDRRGMLVVEAQFRKAASFSGGVAPATTDPTHLRWGLIDRTGAWVTDHWFSYIGTMSEGLAPAWDFGPPGQPHRTGYIDRSGRYVFERTSITAGQFSEGLAAVRENDGPTVVAWGYIDAGGKVAIPRTLEQAQPFSEGLAAAEFPDGRFGYLDHRGRLVISLEHACYELADLAPFSEGLAAVRFAIDPTASFVDSDSVHSRATRRTGYIDKRGEIVIPPRFAAARAFSEGVAAVCEQRDPAEKRCKWGFISH